LVALTIQKEFTFTYNPAKEEACMKVKKLMVASAMMLATALPAAAHANQYCVDVTPFGPEGPGATVCTPDLPIGDNSLIHCILTGEC
jgi:hypothetical protein